MTMHMVAYASSILSSGTLTALSVVSDPTVNFNGTLLTVPDKYNQVIGAAALTVAHAQSRAQLQSPSLREIFFPDVAPQVLAATFGGVDFVPMQGDSPMQLQSQEALQFFSNGGGDGTTAQNVYGIVFLSDGPVQPTKGKIFTMQGTTGIQQAVRTWANGAITFSQTLPVGQYDIVGMRVEATGLVAARLIFIGDSAVTRPGVLGMNSSQDTESGQARFGKMGIFGRFNSVTPPSLEVLGGTATSQVLYLDLIKAA